ncbi:MAG: riboflavin kinase/FMN adenylyltransferase [Maribacter sp.]|jgi:riboflavin kinase/FMN adenylyltransferase
MKVYRDLSALGEIKNAVVTIGSYDGVHTGHQKILERVRQLAKEEEGESVLITFHPHPRLVVNPNDTSLRLLTTVDEKIELVERYGIDHLVFVPFTKEFSLQSPQEYIENFLVKYFQPLKVVIGYDHKFGNKRKGDINLLKNYSEEYGYQVEEISKQEVENIAVSSTKIRAAISQGDIIPATELLNHYFSVTGEVVRGLAIGKGIGFPTANMKIANPHKLIPAGGIYAVYTYHEGQRYDGMLYLGRRPTLENHNNYVCEVNIFDFDKDIYGEELKVDFVRRIRNDEKFPGLDQLKKQLIQDKANALAVLGEAANTEKKAEQYKPLPKVAVVILNYNGRDFLKDFIPSVLDSTYSNMDVYVADNASIDGSITFLKNSFPEVKLIQMTENHGFAEGYNQALKKVHADYFVLLNSDVEPQKDWIEPIIELMERDRTVGACQPKIRDYYNRDKFEYAGACGGWLDNWGYPFCRGRIFSHLEEDKGQYNTSEEVFWATGAAMFVRADLFKALGGFDGSYFAHMEEVDFCWRLKRAGYKVMVKPKSVVYHVGGGTLNSTSPYKTYLNFRNSLITLYKNEPKSRLMWLIPLRLVLDGVAGVKFLFQAKFPHIKSIVKAHWDFFRSMPEYREKSYDESEAIERISIGKFDRKGIYPKSIVFQHFLKRKKMFRNL